MASLANLYSLNLTGNQLTWSKQAAPGVERDRAVLAAFYNAVDGDNWRDNTNWLSETLLDGWHGVQAGGDGRVTRLDLSHNNLSGELPLELGSLANLTGSPEASAATS